jgi:hypothetical protein
LQRETSAVTTRKVLKVLCDTNTLFHNIRGEKRDDERRALSALLQMQANDHLVLLRSQVQRAEVANTENKEQRDKLEADYMALAPVAKEENVSGFNYVPGPTGSFTSNPTSDLDSLAYRDCKRHGIDDRDTLHILRAVENSCDVFLTLDKRTIMPHRDWLEHRFPGLKIRFPSELAAELLRDCS